MLSPLSEEGIWKGVGGCLADVAVKRVLHCPQTVLAGIIVQFLASQLLQSQSIQTEICHWVKIYLYEYCD